MKSLVRFFFPHRLGRLSFLIRLILLGTFSIWWKLNMAEVTTVIVAVAISLYWFCFNVIPRARDCRLPWWFLVLMFIPALNVLPVLALLFSRTKLSDRRIMEIDGGDASVEA